MENMESAAPGRFAKLYLSGPMTGYPDLNFPAFHAAARRLRGLGYVVVNPAELNPAGSEKSWHDCMRDDIAALVYCDVVALLPGWENSRGAQLEVEIARRMDLRVFLASSISNGVELALAA